jgi:hypothetical protein
MSDNKIISIHINGIGFGYVVLNEKGKIIDYGMVAIQPMSNDKCLKRIKEIVSYHQPEALILENDKNSKKSERVKNLTKRISNYGKNDLKITRYTKEEIQNTFEIFKAKNKYERSRKISEGYPELKSKLPERRKAWESENYYQGIFDAMSLFLTHQYLDD